MTHTIDATGLTSAEISQQVHQALAENGPAHREVQVTWLETEMRALEAVEQILQDANTLNSVIDYSIQAAELDYVLKLKLV